MAFVLLLASCAAPYQVEQSTDKFSDPNQPEIYRLTHNKIMSDYLGVAADDELRPFVMRNRESGKVVTAGVDLIVSNTSAGIAGDYLMIRPGDKLIFLADGERIELKAVASDIDHTVSTPLASVYVTRRDEARYLMTAEQLEQIAFATKLEFKAQGRNSYATWPRTNFTIMTSFRDNLKRFYNEQVRPFL
ncbi:MAG: hypothetical protein SV201_04920 [Pseudomonadota bacterium]|nr:hypothetical protein [Pseudomonadota bacterium]